MKQNSKLLKHGRRESIVHNQQNKRTSKVSRGKSVKKLSPNFVQYRVSQQGEKCSLDHQKTINDVWAVTWKLEEQNRSILKQRKYSLNQIGPKQKRQHQNVHWKNREDQKMQEMNKNKSRNERKRSCSFTRRSNKIDSASRNYLKQKISRHASLFGHQRMKVFNLKKPNESRRKSLSEFEIDQQKLVLLTEGNLNKIIQDFFSYVISINNVGNREQANDLKGFKYVQKKTNLIQRYFMWKNQTEKLSREKFLNMCYSLYHHMNKLVNHLKMQRGFLSGEMIHKINLWTFFDKIIELEFQQEEILLFLSLRTSYEAIFGKVNTISFPKHLKQIKQYFHAVRDGYNDLSSMFFELTLNKFKGQTTIAKDIFLFYVFYDCFLQYRVSQSKKTQPSSSVKQQQKKQNRMHSIIKDEQSEHFWRANQYVSIHKQQFIIHSKQYIDQQCAKLVEILCSEMSKTVKKAVLNKVQSKAHHLMIIVSQMSKIKWFEQFSYSFDQTPQFQQAIDLQQIEKLQKMLKNIRQKWSQKYPTSLQLTQFSKTLLTPRIFLIKLYKLIEDCSVTTTS